MKTLLNSKVKIFKLLILLSFNLFHKSVNSQTFPYLSFTNATLQSGTPLQQGAVYKFTNIKTGVDAFVTIQSLMNGAMVTNIDQFGGVGYDGGFQPIVSSVTTGSPNSYARFLIEFKNTDGSVYTFANLATTGLDIDGTTLSVLEYCRINMNGGTVAYQSTTPEISVTQNGSLFTSTNIAGNNVSGIDSTKKEVMFTVRNSNVSSLTIDFGTIYTSGSGARNFSAFFGDFQYPNMKILPVKLVSFTATLNNKNTELKWTTSSEINVSHFVVEKSTDGINFNEVGVVFAYGTASSITNYNFTDHLGNVQSGIFYYRIRSVDIDEKSELSQTRMVRLSSKSDKTISITAFPNPVQNELRVTIPANWQNIKVVYELYSSNGIMVNRMEKANSSQTESFSVNNLSSGTYFVLVKCNGATAQQKIVKQ